MLLGLSGCGQDKPMEISVESRPVKMFKVALGGAQFERSFPAITEAGDSAELSFRVSGQIRSIDVAEGQIVRQSQVLAELDSAEYKLLAKQANAEFNLTRVHLERSQKLYKDQVVSEQDLDQAMAQYKAAKAQLQHAKENVRYTSIVAPFDGAISLISADEHEFVLESQTVMRIQSNRLLKVMFQLPAHLFNRFVFETDMTASMVFDAYPNQQYRLDLQEVDTEADPATGSFKVTMSMNYPTDSGVLPGMAGMVNVMAGGMSDVFIPQSALFEEGGETYVWRVKHQGDVEKILVTLNSEGKVIAGLEDGDQIVSSGVKEINAETKVRPWVKERGL
nr:efflux RND transporter periplasmic adaptor subunit [Vibrio sp. RE88]